MNIKATSQRESGGVQFFLRMFKKRNKSGWIGKIRLKDEPPGESAIPFTDFCDLRDKIKVLMRGK